MYTWNVHAVVEKGPRAKPSSSIAWPRPAAKRTVRRSRCQLWKLQWSHSCGLPVPDTSMNRHVRITVTATKGDALLLPESRRTGILAIPNLVLARRAKSRALELKHCIVWA